MSKGYPLFEPLGPVGKIILHNVCPILDENGKKSYILRVVI